MIGPVLDADGVAVTDCVVADFEGSVNGGDPAALNGSATLTHRGVGFYSLALTATDLATVGSFEVTINDTTNSCGMKELTVIEEAIYDALFAASANGFAGAAGSSTVTFSNTTIGTATNVTTVNGLANNVITAAATASDFGTEVGTAVWATAARTLTAATNITDSGNAILMTASGFVRGDFSSINDEDVALTPESALNFLTFFNNAAGISSLTLDTVATSSELAKVPKSDGTATWNATALASIQTEANDALVANHLDHLFQTAYDPASKPGAADALLNELVENDGGVARYTANALEQAPTGGSAPTVEEISDEVWTAAARTLTAATNITSDGNQIPINAGGLVLSDMLMIGNGEGVVSSAAAGNFVSFFDNASGTSPLILDGVATAASIAALNNLSSAQAQTAATAALNAYDPPTRAELTTDTNSVLTAVGDVPTNAELTTALADLPTNAELATAISTGLATYDPPTRSELTTDINSVLAQLPSSPVKNAAFTYTILMVDETDHSTPETGLTITMTRSIDGAAFAAATGVVTEISSGHYKVVASAADMNGDFVTHLFTATGADDLTIAMKTVS